MLGERKGAKRSEVVRVRDHTATAARDELAIEEPLEIRLELPATGGAAASPRAIAVTMRTPGADFELAAGFLYGEGVLDTRAQVREIAYCTSEEQRTYNVVTVSLRPGAALPDLSRLERNFYVSSSCGVCGKASLDAVEEIGCAALPDLGERWDAEWLGALPGQLREHQSLFARTGGLHAAGVFRADQPPVVREDVGRHNAVDKAVGALLLEGGLPAARAVLAISGRASFEILQKAVRAGLATVVAVGAPSSLAVEMAERFHVTLLGFARGGDFNVYAGAGRVRLP
ncbi:MAG: formate dehydrogenase accessory sulfurtransferase FdhD [Gemmatimonadota bacterium]